MNQFFATAVLATVRREIGRNFPLLRKACVPNTGGPQRRYEMKLADSSIHPGCFGFTASVMQFASNGDHPNTQRHDNQNLGNLAVRERGVSAPVDLVSWFTSKGMEVAGTPHHGGGAVMVSRDGQGNFVFLTVSRMSGALRVTAEFCDTKQARRYIRSMSNWGLLNLAADFVL